MTCIAWDGVTLAADQQASCAGVRTLTTKIRKLSSGEVIAWTGDEDSGRMVAHWYECGADPAKWPECQKDKDAWSRLIVAGPGGVRVFERQPLSVPVRDRFFAWGSGRDFALAAMHLGQSARSAVKVACVFDTGCGGDVDSFDLYPRSARPPRTRLKNRPESRKSA